MESTVAQKLDSLLKLQAIDSTIDNIKKVRGDLPEEVRDLEDEVIGFQTRIAKYNGEIDEVNHEIDGYKAAKKDSEKLIAKYKEQQMNVRNNREFEAIAKELELQELEIVLAEKRIKEADFKAKGKQAEIEGTEANMNERKALLETKQNELSLLIAESEEEEKALEGDRNKAASKVEERLLNSYMRVRNNSVNGLAVVMVSRGACGGCFNTVPPQRQADIREKKKIIVCEHCGRILADVE